MGVPTIALYASPPSSVCSTPHPCQINSNATYDFELNPRPASSSSASTTQKAPIVGGLSCLFSSSSVRQSSSSSFTCAGDDIASLRHDRGEELGSSFCYSSYPSLKCRDQSPVSVFQGPVSCGTVGIGGGGSARSPPIKILRDRSNDFAGSFRAGRDGLFNGFVRNALGSCIDYDSPSFPMPAVSGFDEDSCNDSADEFQFNLEDSLVETEITPDRNAEKLLLDAQLRHKIFYDEFVIKAFYEAEKAHRGQMRASGDPYLQHCVETAVLLATVGANSTVVAAGLMHDTLDDSFTGLDHIRERLGDGVADLVEGVSKMSQLSKLARENDTAHKTVEADRLHTMFLAMVDARAVLIKLADRLHNMRTLSALAMVKQQRFAKETLEIFVPLANRLGISSWKEQLENLCFKHLNPVQHKELSSKLVKSFDEATITSAIEKLEGALKDGGVSYHVLCGRHKSLYSIYRKMLKKKLNMDEIHDIHGLRLVVENDEDCYTALRIIHQLWPEVPGKLKDYINHPKFNGYRSLHTVVMGEDMVPFEVQIRTKEMHLQAEFGFAAHWRYKEGDCKHSSFVLQMVEWARWVVTWQCEAMELSSFGNANSIRPPCPFPSHSTDCPYLCSPQCDHDGPIFVIVMENEKMSVQEFPANSTVMDLLEKVGCGNLRGSPYGFPVKEELRPRLNHKPVNGLSCKLKTGDVVELTPTISDKSLTEYREEIQRMYNRGGFQVSTVVAPS